MKLNYFSVDNEEGVFQGFIEALNKKHAQSTLKQINPKFHIKTQLTNNGRSGYNKKYQWKLKK